MRARSSPTTREELRCSRTFWVWGRRTPGGAGARCTPRTPLERLRERYVAAFLATADLSSTFFFVGGSDPQEHESKLICVCVQAATHAGKMENFAFNAWCRAMRRPSNSRASRSARQAQRSFEVLRCRCHGDGHVFLENSRGERLSCRLRLFRAAPRLFLIATPQVKVIMLDLRTQRDGYHAFNIAHRRFKFAAMIGAMFRFVQHCGRTAAQPAQKKKNCRMTETWQLVRFLSRLRRALAGRGVGDGILGGGK